VNGVEWSPDTVCVFDGLQSVVERCVVWYEDRLSAEKAGDLVREDAKDHTETPSSSSVTPMQEESIPSLPTNPIAAMPEGINVIESEAIVDRKSTFVGRACRISHPSQVYCQLYIIQFDFHNLLVTSGAINLVASNV